MVLELEKKGLKRNVECFRIDAKRIKCCPYAVSDIGKNETIELAREGIIQIYLAALKNGLPIHDIITDKTTADCTTPYYPIEGIQVKY